MSRENVEVVERLVEAGNRRDIDAFIALVSPDVEWEDSLWFVEPVRIYRGRAEVREWFNRALEPWEGFHAEVEEIIEAGDDRVFGGVLFTGRGAASGVDTEIHGWFVVWIAGGLITKRQFFLDRDDALQAVGLEE